METLLTIWENESTTEIVNHLIEILAPLEIEVQIIENEYEYTTLRIVKVV